MPQKEDNYFFDDKWNEYVYNILSNVSQEQKLRLNSQELQILKSDGAMKRFASSAPLRQQLVMLTKIGYDWFFGFYPAGKNMPELMKKTYRQHTLKDTRVEVMQELIDSHVFVIDNRAVATALSMMAMNNHANVFMINSEFLKIPRELAQYERSSVSLAKLVKDHNPNNATAEFREALRSLDLFNEIVGEVFRSEDYLRTVMGVTRLDFWILHFLFKHRNNYVSLDYLKRQLYEKYALKGIALRCNYLWKEMNVIDKLPKTTNTSYTIKSDGILLLGQIMNTIINRSSKA